jgi:ABC-type amino acid transport system permease subunit
MSYENRNIFLTEKSSFISFAISTSILLISGISVAKADFAAKTIYHFTAIIYYLLLLLYMYMAKHQHTN